MRIDPRWDLVEAEFGKNCGHYESLFALGNGYLGTRGATEENYRLRTPGTYLAGLFDQRPPEVTELANLPDWLSVELALGGERFDLTSGEILDYRRVLQLYKGTLTREVLWRSPQGRLTRLIFKRFVSLENRHLSGLKVELFPKNYAGPISITSRLDGQVTNSGTQHFAPLEQSTCGKRGIYLVNESYQRRYLVVQSAAHNVRGKILQEGFATGPRRVEYWAELEAEKGASCALEKLVATFSSNDLEFAEFGIAKTTLVEGATQESLAQGKLGFDHLQGLHSQVWQRLWSQADLLLTGPDFDQLALRFAIFHLIQMAPEGDYRAGLAAKGLTGEGYRGHVFWDAEIFMLPFFVHLFPKLARNQLRYRHHTLPGAMRKAKLNGYAGAMYAWESADSGDEATPSVGGIDFQAKKPMPILCGELEQHITADIAYAVAHYLQVTEDKEFLTRYGAEIVLLGARFWASRVDYNGPEDCYEIKGVIGPDEYKENVDNNYYTNALVQKHLEYAARIFQELGPLPALRRWGFSAAEAERWLFIASKIKLPRRGNLLLQFAGFLQLEEIEVLKYRDTPGLLQQTYSWPQINAAQVLKQADVLMLLHLFSQDYSAEEKRVNWDFYEPKTMHDSSLSAAIHSAVASDLGSWEAAYAYFQKASRLDLQDGLGNSAHGLHAASLGGLWQAAVYGFAGIRVQGAALSCLPRLPKQWAALEFKLQFKGAWLNFRLTRKKIEVRLLTPGCSSLVEAAGRLLTLDEKTPAHTVLYAVEK